MAVLVFIHKVNNLRGNAKGSHLPLQKV